MNYTSQEKLNLNFISQFILESIQFVYRLIANNIPIDSSQSESVHAMGWWIEIFTAKPACLYYFGHFDTLEEAQSSQAGFVQDLMAEGADQIKVQLQLCQPKRLTVSF